MISLNIDIVSDVVCPWCFVGKRRLAHALELLRLEREDVAVTVRWLPFFLNPHTPPEGEPYTPFLERKFGGVAQVEALWTRLRTVGHSVGINFAFEKITIRPNTFQAHRLIHWAQEQAVDTDRIDALVERLFAAHFLRGEHIGNAHVLCEIAVECGLPAGSVADYLATDNDADFIRTQERRNREFGVKSVPTYFFDGSHALSGAESAQTLLEAMRRQLDNGPV
jgi:predicted DsbA family dithiol-disulfide isomerase